MSNYTRILASYIKNARLADFPPATVERAKLMILHTLGVSLNATLLRQYRDVVAIAKEASAGVGSGVPGSTLWGDGAKVSPETAGFAAGALSDMLDWEDCSWGGHPSAAVVPAAVVGAEAYGKSGEELLTAAILGYEIYQRFTMGASGNIVGNNVFAAIVVLARLLDLDEEQINKAFGIATACAILPVNVHEETMSDALNYLYGLKVDGAFTQALTALQGVYNQEDALDDPTAFTAHMQQQQPEWLTRDLGEEFYLNDILVKKWPANYYVQTYAEIAYRLQKKHHIDPERIESVILEPAFARRFWFSDTGFQSLTHAQFSIPYVVAAVLYYPDEPGERWYQPETLEDPKVVTLMNKVTATSFIKERRPLSSKNYNRLKAWQPKKYITIRLQDGREFKDGLYTQPGDTSYMFSREEFEDFFRQRTRPVLSSVKTEKIIAFLADLEHQPDASLLPQYLY